MTDVNHMHFSGSAPATPISKRNLLNSSNLLHSGKEGYSSLHLALSAGSESKGASTYYRPALTHQGARDKVSAIQRGSSRRASCGGRCDLTQSSGDSCSYRPAISLPAPPFLSPRPQTPSSEKSAIRRVTSRRTSCGGRYEWTSRSPDDKKIPFGREFKIESMPRLDCPDSATTSTVSTEIDSYDGGPSVSLKKLQLDLEKMEKKERHLRKKQNRALHKLRKMQKEVSLSHC